MQGLRLSTIAASDDHRSQPGKPHWGLAAVRAPALTREAIFDALHARRTYGTTGQRILLDFRVNDAPMGSEIALEAPLPEPCAGTSPECGERAAATAALAPRSRSRRTGPTSSRRWRSCVSRSRMAVSA